VAHNLNIPFDQLKAQMTGSNSVSLGKAIKNLRPDLDGTAVKSNVTLAERQTERDVQQAAWAAKQDRFAARIASDTKLVAWLTPLLPLGHDLNLLSGSHPLEWIYSCPRKCPPPRTRP